MRNHHNPYPREYREQIMALHRAGRNIDDLAAEFEPHRDTIKGWIRAATRLDAPPPCSDEREELLRLRKENRILRQERDILSKAAAWFANRETNSRSSIS